MAVYPLLSAATLLILLTSQGCHSSQPACGKLMKNQGPDDPLPWQAVIISKGGTKCLATVISEHWVLTDGGCGLRPGQDAEVLLAGEDYKKPHPVTGSECNPSLGKEGGLCLLKLSKPLTFTGSIGPICLAAEGSAFHSGHGTYVATGSPKAPIDKAPVVGHNECRCRYPSVQKSKICVVKKEGKEAPDKCQMSFGAALMDRSDESWTQIGVGGFDQQCLKPGDFKSFTRVSYFQDWIEKVTNTSAPHFLLSQPKGIDPDERFNCPTACSKAPKCESPDGCEEDFSVFGHGVNMGPSFSFVLLCVLVLSLFATRW